jgi:H+-translocating NAD(P) transhydrogenase subunit alpha
MKIALLRETAGGERRVPIVPDSLKRLAAKQLQFSIETGSGDRAGILDRDYEASGATIAPAQEGLLAACDLVLRLRTPALADVARMTEGSALIAPLAPLTSHALVAALAARNITAFAVDTIPRTTVAQMMDVLSSQGTVAGYAAVLAAAQHLPRFFPMLMTAAGTIAPATALIVGAGVAGLSAIGTAKRLGARVEAFDVRKVVQEQVESLGAKFIRVESDEDAQTASGYAKEVSESYKAKQAELLALHVGKADVVICTALIPGRRAPVLVTRAMVARMKPGSVIVDLAAEQLGNCEATAPGATVVVDGVTIVGDFDFPSRLAVHASQMYSRNMEKYLMHLTKDGALALDRNDEITSGSLITHAGAIVHQKTQEAMNAAVPSEGSNP